MQKENKFAICIIKNKNIQGTVRFSTTEEDYTLVQAEFFNLPKGLHGFHIHEFGNLEYGCASAGGHYNPHKVNHGDQLAGYDDRHVGDMGNLKSDGKVARKEFVDKLIKLSGKYSVIGRTVVVHADEDDLGKGGFEDSKTTGHAGARLGCAVIGLSKPFDIK